MRSTSFVPRQIILHMTFTILLLLIWLLVNVYSIHWQIEPISVKNNFFKLITMPVKLLIEAHGLRCTHSDNAAFSFYILVDGNVLVLVTYPCANNSFNSLLYYNNLSQVMGKKAGNVQECEPLRVQKQNQATTEVWSLQPGLEHHMGRHSSTNETGSFVF